MAWHDKPEVKKGDLGESIIKGALIRARWLPFKPDVDGAHHADKVAVNPKSKTAIFFEVKTKPARYVYPDTSIPIRVSMKDITTNILFSMKLYRSLLDLLMKNGSGFMAIFLTNSSNQNYVLIIPEIC